MKLYNIFKQYAKTTALISGVFMVTACSDYLDVVPPEQAQLTDGVKNYDNTLGFLYSCYAGIREAYSYSSIEFAADESVLPETWRELTPPNIMFGLNTPLNVQDNRWSNNYYPYIGQVHLFLQHLPNAIDVTEENKKLFAAEAKFLRAYYHMQTLFLYGPCPIIDRFYPSNTPASEYPGRSHFDYVVNWVAKEYDEVAQVLPATRSGDQWGRATSTMAKALKARMLVYAASPLWNGSFPYPEWKNTNYETPGYGKDLVSLTYDASKWERARVACEEALTYATGTAGHRLYDNENYYQTQSGVNLPYVPGVNPATAEGQAFLKKVMLMRYVVATRVAEGNNEIIWGHSNQGHFGFSPFFPHYVLTQTNGQRWVGWGGVSPLLNTTVHYFYTKNGKRPAHDSGFTAEANWYKSANLTGTGRNNIINLHVNREPRFYAWLAFDGGDYGNRLNNGNPLLIELRNSDRQGYNKERFARDNNATGYFSQKYLPPTAMVSAAGNFTTESKPRPFIRLAELYLNLAECHAALGNATETFNNLNIVRNRAGVPNLDASSLSAQSLTEWVLNERFIELWGEGHRYYDTRRWLIAPQTMAAGARKGLNAEVKDPSFEEFNKPTTLQQDFVWHNRMYLHPIERNESYKNPQLVQAPGY